MPKYTNWADRVPQQSQLSLVKVRLVYKFMNLKSLILQNCYVPGIIRFCKKFTVSDYLLLKLRGKLQLLAMERQLNAVCEAPHLELTHCI